jgi:hypothetical protein
MSELQHCPACDEEYVAGVAACVDCGGPLTPGPLARLEARARRSDAAPAAPATHLDRLLLRLPGAQADQAVRALLLEGIACRVECGSLGKTYTADRPPEEPFAVNLPVAVYVDAAHEDAAHEVVTSLEDDDLIGEQWSDADEPDPGREANAEVAAEDGTSADSDAAVEGAIEPEGTSLRTAVLIVVIIVVLLFLFGRK